MRIDLHEALGDIASAVEADVTSDRLGRRVHRMVGSVRRRRAARHTAQGAVGLGTAAAVGLVGVNVVGGGPGPGTWRPWAGQEAEGPATGGPDRRPLTCGAAAPAPTGAVGEFTLEISAPAETVTNKAVPVTGYLRNVGPGRSVATMAPMEVLAIADGRVVGIAESSGGSASADGSLGPGDVTTSTATSTITACDGIRTLGAGDYELLGRMGLSLGDEDVVLVSEPVPFTLADRGTTAETAAETLRKARVAVEATLADPLPAAEYPACGSTVARAGAALPGEDDVPVQVELSGPVTAGVPLADGRAKAVLTVRSVDDRTVRGALGRSGAVLLKDGVVVGGVPFPEVDGTPPGRLDDQVEIDAVGVPTDAAVELVVCADRGLAHGAEPLPLPPGQYELAGTTTVMVDESVVGHESSTDVLVVVAWSDPVPVTVE